MPFKYPADQWSISDVLLHIGGDTRDSPFVSFSRSLEIAKRYATDIGIIYQIAFDPREHPIVNPVSAINGWISENMPLEPDDRERCEEALQLAEEDDEVLLFGAVSPTIISEIIFVSE